MFVSPFATFAFLLRANVQRDSPSGQADQKTKQCTRVVRQGAKETFGCRKTSDNNLRFDAWYIHKLLVYVVHRTAPGLPRRKCFLRDFSRLAHGVRLLAFLHFVYQSDVVHFLEKGLSGGLVLNAFMF